MILAIIGITVLYGLVGAAAYLLCVYLGHLNPGLDDEGMLWLLVTAWPLMVLIYLISYPYSLIEWGWSSLVALVVSKRKKK